MWVWNSFSVPFSLPTYICTYLYSSKRRHKIRLQECISTPNCTIWMAAKARQTLSNDVVSHTCLRWCSKTLQTQTWTASSNIKPWQCASYYYCPSLSNTQFPKWHYHSLRDMPWNVYFLNIILISIVAELVWLSTLYKGSYWQGSDSWVTSRSMYNGRITYRYVTPSIHTVLHWTGCATH